MTFVLTMTRSCCQLLQLLLTVMMGNFVISHEQCPSSCACLGNTVDCSSKQLSDIPADLPSWTEILDVSSNDIKQLSGDSLGETLGHLQEINLSNNGLKSFNCRVLKAAAAELRVINAAYNDLTSVPRQLQLTSQLTHLILNHNEIGTVDVESFGHNHVTDLEVLDLGHNRIRRLSNGSLTGALSTLQHLFLNNNGLRSLERGVFDALTSLQWLKLNKNRLRTISPAVFSRLRSLRYLDLNSNRLQRIDGLTFHGLSNIVSLRLRRNLLTELKDGAFYGLTSIESMQLDYNNLSHVHSGFLFGLETLQHLSLSSNCISVVEADSWTSCTQLTYLDLSTNQLTAITAPMFAQLTSLQHLKLGWNQISYITEGSFDDLSALKTLELSHNKLSSVLDESSPAFIGLTSLTHLVLAANHIKSMSKHAFDGLDTLRHVDLDRNDVSSIEDDTFTHLHNLHTVHINTSNLLCDCHLSWLSSWLRTTDVNIVNIAGLHCAHPSSLHGRSVTDVDINQFICDEYLKPVITSHPTSQVALKDGTLNLTCQVVTSSQSTLSVLWKKDHTVLSSVLSKTTVTPQRGVDDEDVIHVTSILTVSNVKSSDAGVYQCVAANVVATVYSTRSIVTVSVYPRLTKTPVDLTVRVGSTARLQCAASGSPTPEVAWQKDGGFDFPAARERRMHVMPDDDVFFIVDVKMEDAGLYGCTASNDAGVARANATLAVIERPMLVHSAGQKVSHNGDVVVFECLSHPASRGSSAQLRVDWLKDGQPIVADSQLLHSQGSQPIATDSQSQESRGSQTIAADAQSSLLKDSQPIATNSQLQQSRDSRPVATNMQSESRRYYLIADSQILVLLNARQSDSGVYTCIVSNAVGSQRAVSTLRVIDRPLTSSHDGDDDDGEMVTVRVGLVVIAAVCGVVLTSVAWVVVIYCLQRRHDLTDSASSTSTDETVIPVASSSIAAAAAEVNTLDSLQHCIHLPADYELRQVSHLQPAVQGYCQQLVACHHCRQHSAPLQQQQQQQQQLPHHCADMRHRHVITADTSTVVKLADSHLCNNDDVVCVSPTWQRRSDVDVTDVNRTLDSVDNCKQSSSSSSSSSSSQLPGGRDGHQTLLSQNVLVNSVSSTNEDSRMLFTRS